MKFKSFLKQKFPILVRILNRFNQIIYPFTFAMRLRAPRRNMSRDMAIFYLTNIHPKPPPTRREYANGGQVKMVYLAEAFPHSFPSANILYTVSSVGHPLAEQVILKAKERKIKVVVNQNGVAYPAWHGAGWEKTNQDLNRILEQADYIVYQSQFCQSSARRFLSPPDVPCEVIYNPVDTKLFSPMPGSIRPADLTLLLGGNQFHRYRVELAMRTLKAISRENPSARLIVTGNLWKPEDDATNWTRNILRELNLTEKVTFTGRYSQEQAPSIYGQAHILLHTQYNDASPTLVLEAMASGLPVAYIDSGGVPELVADAGIGVLVEHNWERINLPRPEEMSNAVFQIMSNYREYSDNARERVMRLFSLEIFIANHSRIFEKVLDY